MLPAALLLKLACPHPDTWFYLVTGISPEPPVTTIYRSLSRDFLGPTALLFAKIRWQGSC